MARKAKTGSFDDLLEITPDPLRPVAKALRELIFEIDPNACEVVRMGYRSASYGPGSGKMQDDYVYIMPYRRWINLGFYQGIDLPDPEALLEGSGLRMRHVKMRSLEAVRQAGLRELVESALAQRLKTLGS